VKGTIFESLLVAHLQLDYLWRKNPKMMCLMGIVGGVGNVKGRKTREAVSSLNQN